MAALVLVLCAALCAAAPLGSPDIEQNSNSSLLNSGTLTRVQSRIIDGEPACRGQFRHHALVVGDGVFLCGGSLIKPTAILTIGWCVDEFQIFDIRLGTIMREGPDDSAFTVQSTWGLIHPEYDTGAYFNNDVAVILLNVKVPLGRSIWPITLPSLDEVHETFTGQRALISGWGKPDYTGPFQDRLRFAEVTVISNDLCKKYYPEGYIIDSSLCAGNKKTGFCVADHGGALVIKPDGRYKQIGIASFLVDSCDRPAPGVYTRVTSVLGWIHEVAGRLEDWGAAEESFYDSISFSK